MRTWLSLLILILAAPSVALERVVRGYTPLTLSMLGITLEATDKDIPLIQTPYQGWLKLGDYLSPQALTRYQIPRNRKIWVDVCEPADEVKLKQKVSTWLRQQSWSSNVKVRQIEFQTPQICATWNKVTSFDLQASHLLSQKLKLVNTAHPNQTLDIALSADYLVWSSLQDIAAQVSLKPGWFTSQWRPLNQVSIQDLSLIPNENWTSRKTISAGRALTSLMLKRTPAIESGEQILATLIKGGLSIDVSARALGRGEIGEHIKVLVEGANSPVSGQIIDKGVVKIGA